jgi:hypothetical protein
MHIPPERLLEGALQTLHDAVLPHVEDKGARAQLFAVMDVLNNLRDRVEDKTSLLLVEAGSGLAALSAAAPLLAQPTLDQEVARVPAGPPAVRAAAVNRLLVLALTLAEDLPAERRQAARAPLLAHMRGQVARQVAVLKHPLLDRVLKG